MGIGGKGLEGWANGRKGGVEKMTALGLRVGGR